MTSNGRIASDQTQQSALHFTKTKL